MRKQFFYILLIIPAGFFSGLYSCGIPKANDSVQKNDSAVINDSVNAKKDSTAAEPLLNGKPVSFWLQSPEISAAAKFILSDSGDINLNTKDSLWNICDSMLHAKKNRPVYLYAVTQTLKLSDGAYSETSFGACKELMEDSVMEFVHCFSREPMIKISDLELWSHAVFMQICLEKEGNEKAGTTSIYNKIKFYEGSMNPGEKAYAEMFLSDIMDEAAKYHHPNK
jgi:hypothetical protein